MILGGLGVKIRKVPAMEDIETILASVSSPNSRRGNRVLVILALREIQHLEEVDPNLRGAREVRCSIQRRLVLSVAELTLENADRALMSALVVVRVDTWSETVPRTEVRLGVMLGLSLPHRVQQQSSHPRGTDFIP